MTPRTGEQDVHHYVNSDTNRHGYAGNPEADAGAVSPVYRSPTAAPERGGGQKVSYQEDVQMYSTVKTQETIMTVNNLILLIYKNNCLCFTYKIK